MISAHVEDGTDVKLLTSRFMWNATAVEVEVISITI